MLCSCARSAQQSARQRQPFRRASAHPEPYTVACACCVFYNRPYATPAHGLGCLAGQPLSALPRRAERSVSGAQHSGPRCRRGPIHHACAAAPSAAPPFAWAAQQRLEQSAAPQASCANSSVIRFLLCPAAPAGATQLCALQRGQEAAAAVRLVCVQQRHGQHGPEARLQGGALGNAGRQAGHAWLRGLAHPGDDRRRERRGRQQLRWQRTREAHLCARARSCQ